MSRPKKLSPSSSEELNAGLNKLINVVEDLVCEVRKLTQNLQNNPQNIPAPVSEEVDEPFVASKELILLEHFERLRPPSFSGGLDPDKAKDWVLELEKLFEPMRVNEFEKVTLATFNLRDRADDWWRSVKKKLETENKNLPEADRKVLDWKEFTQLFFAKFTPEAVIYRKELEFEKLSQGESSVAEYEAKFSSLIRYVTYMDKEDLKVQSFVRGLNPDMRLAITLWELKTYDEVVASALCIEQRSERFKERREQIEEEEAAYERNMQMWSNEERNVTGWKRRHKDKGHSRNVKACLGCGSTSHMRRDCPMG